MIKDLINSDKIIKKEGLVYMHNLIYISKYIKNKIITIYHNLLLYRHLEINQTTELVARNYYFLDL